MSEATAYYVTVYSINVENAVNAAVKISTVTAGGYQKGQAIYRYGKHSSKLERMDYLEFIARIIALKDLEIPPLIQ